MIRIVGTAQKDKEVLLYYTYPKGAHNFFKVIFSKTGFDFQGQSKYVIVFDEKQREEKNFNWKDFRIAKVKDSYYLTYKLDGKITSPLLSATSEDLVRWTKSTKIEGINDIGCVVPEFKYKNKYVMYYGEKSISLAFSGDLRTWKPQLMPLLESRTDSFDAGELVVGNVFDTGQHLLLIYYVKKNTGNFQRYAVGACAFDRKDPSVILWRSEHPLWEQPVDFYANSIFPLGSAILHDELILYWSVAESTIFAVSCPIPGKHAGLKDKVFASLKRHEHNPILTPRPDKSWESRQTFNTAALYEDGKVHFVYRAQGTTDLNVLGYASSTDGIHIDERSDNPIYVPRESFELPNGDFPVDFVDPYASGGGFGGCEDPRLTKIDDTIYMTYIAHVGGYCPRVALSSISVNDFLEKKWDNWKRPKLITAPGIVNKNAVIFPEKVHGKYVVMHRVYPNILVDYVEDLEFNEYLKGQYVIRPRYKYWDSKKIGAGPPPIKTKDGWLLIYQSVGYQDPGRYKIGAMLLDLDNPTKVLYRTNHPLISPDMEYENRGHKAGVVYPCGAVVKDGKLFVYYGGGDTVTCAASENLDKFLYEIKHAQDPKLKHVRSSFVN
jgi:predicted GH43/DUF377 family glycosyl hydrolase